MKWIDITAPTPEENLALDEALLDRIDQADQGTAVLRLWESRQYFIVLGYSNKASSSVDLKACERLKVPVLRRPSGGGTVLQGPGCLNYALLLPLCSQTVGHKNILETNRTIMNTHRKAFGDLLGQPVAINGSTDLVIEDLKFSGNAQRRRKHAILFHGSLLLDFDIQYIEKVMPIPELQPAYRKNRAHSDFLINLKVSADKVKKMLKDTWGCTSELKLDNVLKESTHQLVTDRYSQPSWNLKF